MKAAALLTVKVVLVAILAVAVLTPTANGGLLVTIESASLMPGDTATIDVFIQGQSTLQVVNTFSGLFQLLGDDGAVQLTGIPGAILVDPQYLFVGNSVVVGDGQPLGKVLQKEFPGDTLLLGDGALSGTGSMVMPEQPLLLAQFLVSASTRAQPGTRFLIDLVPGPGSKFLSGPGMDSELSFNTIPGNLTIGTPGTVAPEASTILIWMTAIATALFLFRSRLMLAKARTAVTCMNGVL